MSNRIPKPIKELAAQHNYYINISEELEELYEYYKLKKDKRSEVKAQSIGLVINLLDDESEELKEKINDQFESLGNANWYDNEKILKRLKKIPGRLV